MPACISCRYLERSFQIVTGKASSNHLPKMTDKKTFIHICINVHKAKTVYRSKERSQFITFCCSLLANASIHKDFWNLKQKKFIKQRGRIYWMASETNSTNWAADCWRCLWNSRDRRRSTIIFLQWRTWWEKRLEKIKEGKI